MESRHKRASSRDQKNQTEEAGTYDTHLPHTSHREVRRSHTKAMILRSKKKKRDTDLDRLEVNLYRHETQAMQFRSMVKISKMLIRSLIINRLMKIH